MIKTKPTPKSSVSSMSVSALGSPSALWQPAPTTFDVRGGVLIEVWGPTGTGRTTLALSAPPPIAYIYFHEKVRGIIEPFACVKEIRTYRAGGVFVGEPEEVIRDASKAMHEYESVYYDAFGWARTIIVDTHNEAWYLERLGEFGAPKPTKGRIDRNWAPINNRWMSMLNRVRTQTHTNVVLIGQTEDEWKDSADGFGKKTGKLIRVGTKASDQVLLKADLSIRTDKRTVKRDGENKLEFVSTIFKGWGKADEYEGMELEDELNTLPQILSLITETEAKEWE